MKICGIELKANNAIFVLIDDRKFIDLKTKKLTIENDETQEDIRKFCNEFLLFFSIAAGLATFGFWGFIVGPFVAALFLASSRLLQSSKKIY